MKNDHVPGAFRYDPSGKEGKGLSGERRKKGGGGLLIALSDSQASPPSRIKVKGISPFRGKKEAQLLFQEKRGGGGGDVSSP